MKRNSDHQDVWEAIRELTLGAKELRESMKEVRESQKETDRIVKNLGKKIGELTNGWGKFVEAMVQPAIPKLFKKQGIRSTSNTITSHRNGETMEVDVLGVGEKIVIAVSIKSHLTALDIDAWEKVLPQFFTFFPEYRGRRLYGGVAGIRVDRGVEKVAEKKGFYVLGSSGKAVKLLNQKSFQPKRWEKKK